MFEFKKSLLTRANNFNNLRVLWDEKINYSYNNYVAINAIGEVRLHLYCLLVGSKPGYNRVFSY